MTVSVKMMRVMKWPLWSLCYKKFRVTLCIHHLHEHPIQDGTKLIVDVKWRGPKKSLGPRFRSVKKDRSAEATSTLDGLLEWEQEFECECTFAFAKETGFQPWDVYLFVRKITETGSKRKQSLLGKACVNLADLAPAAGSSRQSAKFPVASTEIEGALSVTLKFEEARSLSDAPDNHKVVSPGIPCITGGHLLWDTEEEEPKPIKSIRTTKKSSGDDTGRLTPTSDESSSPDRFDSDDSTTEDSDLVDGAEISFTTSFRYGRIAGANMIIGRYHDKSSNEEDYVFGAIPKLAEETSSSDSDQAFSQSSMRRMLSWRKRKLSFRSPKARRGEPLLNKAYGDNGGDEIDWDRRQADFANEANGDKKLSSVLDFGESFKVGSWERKELVSRDGQLKLSASVFFASIDQRSESVAGEGACTALVAVVADWLHTYSAFMPSRAELDGMVRDGSAEWRRLYQNSGHRDRFSDGHFDLETVLEAGVRPLTVVPEKSFVGFFQQEGLGGSSDFLEGAMSFDSIWDEVERQGPAVYVVSWNDHFFVVKVDERCVYIIDTLGERLFEGCDQAYLLRFDDEACLARAPREEEKKAGEAKVADEKKPDSSVEARALKEVSSSVPAAIASNSPNSDDERQHTGVRLEAGEAPPEEEVKCCSSCAVVSSPGEDEAPEQQAEFRGSSACREFIKGFFAAVPLRELQSDVQKGRVEKECLHKRLQVEFHYTASLRKAE